MNVCSNSLIKFFTSLISSNINDTDYDKMVDLGQKLAFGVWIKQPKVKELIEAL